MEYSQALNSTIPTTSGNICEIPLTLFLQFRSFKLDKISTVCETASTPLLVAVSPSLRAKETFVHIDQLTD